MSTSVQIADPMVGKTIDSRYVVRRMIGRGGMGVLYEADHVGLDQRVAIKFVLLASDRDTRARFRREARAASRVDHPNVVRLFDAGASSDGVDYLVMEFVEGRDLRDLMRETGPLEPERAVAIACQVLAGLFAIHQAGIIHRDIKPANIVLAGETAKIMDFGIARSNDSGDGLTDTGEMIGTPAFMAPEQIAGARLDHRTDLYSLGVTLFVMLAGHNPFAGITNVTSASMKQLLGAPPRLDAVRPELSAELVDVVARAMSRSPGERFADAAELAEALGRCR